MAPRDKELTIGDIPDYNNKIVIVTDAQDLGLNDGVNATPVPPNTHNQYKEPKQNNLCPKLRQYLHKKTII